MSRKHYFKNISEVKMNELHKNQMKRRTYAKVKWAVKAYQAWREVRIQDTVNYDPIIFNTNLENIDGLSKKSLCFVLTRFVPKMDLNTLIKNYMK